MLSHKIALCLLLFPTCRRPGMSVSVSQVLSPETLLYNMSPEAHQHINISVSDNHKADAQCESRYSESVWFSVQN